MSVLRRSGREQGSGRPPGIVDWSEKAARDRNAAVHRLEPTGRRSVGVGGEKHFQQRLAALAGRRGPDGGIRRSHLAILLPEPENREDPGAIRVWIRDVGTVGYLGREDARAYRPVIALLAERGVYTGCEATLTGGWDRDRRGGGSYGVLLQLGTPAESIASFWLVDVRPRVLAHPWIGRTVTFSGPSLHHLRGVRLDRPAQEVLATHAGCRTWPRLAQQVHAYVVADPRDQGELDRAAPYDVDVIGESQFWYALGFALPLI